MDKLQGEERQNEVEKINVEHRREVEPKSALKDEPQPAPRQIPKQIVVIEKKGVPRQRVEEQQKENPSNNDCIRCHFVVKSRQK